MLPCIVLADAELLAPGTLAASSICVKAEVQSSMHNLHQEASYAVDAYGKTNNASQSGARTTTGAAGTSRLLLPQDTRMVSCQVWMWGIAKAHVTCLQQESQCYDTMVGEQGLKLSRREIAMQPAPSPHSMRLTCSPVTSDSWQLGWHSTQIGWRQSPRPWYRH